MFPFRPRPEADSGQGVPAEQEESVRGHIPALALALLLTACGGTEEETGAHLQSLYQEMAGCTMEAAVSCEYEGAPWRAELRCTYAPEGESTVEVLSPETIAGVRAVLDGENRTLHYEGDVLNAGPVSREGISPAECLPRLMDALREGWIVEENREEWNGVPCWRLCLDHSGRQAERIEATVWLRQEDAAPVRGEIAVDGETVLTAEFTDFSSWNS